MWLGKTLTKHIQLNNQSLIFDFYVTNQTLLLYRPASSILCASYIGSRYCFWRCLSAENVKHYWSKTDLTWWEYVRWWMLEVTGSWWHLTLKAIIVRFAIQTVTFEWLYLATLFSVWRYIFSRVQFHGSKVTAAKNSCAQLWTDFNSKCFWHSLLLYRWQLRQEFNSLTAAKSITYNIHNDNIWNFPAFIFMTAADSKLKK